MGQHRHKTTQCGMCDLKYCLRCVENNTDFPHMCPHCNCSYDFDCMGKEQED